MKDTTYVNKDEIELIQIINTNTKEEIAIFNYVEGNLLMQTKKPYTICVEFKNKKEENEVTE